VQKRRKTAKGNVTILLFCQKMKKEDNPRRLDSSPREGREKGDRGWKHDAGKKSPNVLKSNIVAPLTVRATLGKKKRVTPHTKTKKKKNNHTPQEKRKNSEVKHLKLLEKGLKNYKRATLPFIKGWAKGPKERSQR